MLKPEILRPKLGPKIVLLRDPEASTVATMVLMRVGSRQESEQLSGISHALEHMVFKGTKKYPRPENISQILDGLGANYNAFTSKHSTAYYIKTEASELNTQMSILSQMIFAPRLLAADWAREKNVIIEELKMYDENPVMKIDSLIDQAQYGQTSLGRDIGGSAETVAKFTAKDFKTYWKKFYSEGDATVIVAGKFSPTQVKTLIKKYWPQNRSLSVAETHLAPAIHLSGLVTQIRDNTQVQIAASWPGVSQTDKKLHAYKLFSLILGGTMSSRLFRAVREKHGLAYSVSFSHDAHPDIGSLVLNAGLDASRLEHAVKVIKQELISIVTKGVTAAELKSAKTFYRGQRALRFEDKLELASWYAQDLSWNRPIRDPQTDLAAYEKVTVAQINAIAREALAELPALALIGPATAVERAKNYQQTWKIKIK